jgi:transposase
MGEKRRRFTEEFKREAVRLAFDGQQPVSQVARELDVRTDMLRRWRRGLAGEGAQPSEAEQEVRRLRRELTRTQEERDILKKALAIFSERPQR